jgi:two-component system, OmpR family, alkaline phosphatase synthesis response regulator PhoP
MAKVLIIDDDEDIIDNLTMVLEKNGFTVKVKRDTERVVADVAAIDPDVIILDVMFPEDPYAGFKAARELKGDPRLGRIPILVLSAVNQRSGQSFGFSDADLSEDFLPAQAFIEKPIEPKTLIARINAVLTPKVEP